MSEAAPKVPSPEPPNAAGAAAPGAPAPAARPLAPPSPLVVMIAVAALALGAGVAAGSLLLAPRLIHARQAAALAAADPHHAAREKKKAKKAAKKGEHDKPPVYKLDNIIVNPADSQGQRFLMCSVAIESDDARALDDLREHEIELRDRVVTLLSQQRLERLTAQGARDSLRGELQQVIRPVLGADGVDTELKVYLPQFVIQ